MANEQMDLAKIEQMVAQALQSGVSEEEIVNGLSQQLGIKPEEAAQLVEAVKANMGGGQGGAPAEPTGNPQVDGISLDQAIQAIEQLGIDPQTTLAFLDIIMSMRPSDIDDLAASIQEGEQAQAAEEQAQPSEEELMAAGQI
mgnify:CR=1 FL=1